MKVYLGSIAWRGFEAGFVRSLSLLLKRYPGVAFMPQVGDALVERARGIVATHFLEETDADVLLVIDSDIEFFPDDAMRICEQAHEKQAIVVGAYPTRSLGRPKTTSEFWPDQQVVFADDADECVSIAYGATGFMAAPRALFERMAEDLTLLHANQAWRFYPFYRTEIVDEPGHGAILLSEDFAFCQKARELGFETYLNPHVRLKHWGDYGYRLEDMATDLVPGGAVRLTRKGESLGYTVEVAPQEEPVG